MYCIIILLYQCVLYIVQLKRDEIHYNNCMCNETRIPSAAYTALHVPMSISTDSSTGSLHLGNRTITRRFSVYTRVTRAFNLFSLHVRVTRLNAANAYLYYTSRDR